MQRADVGPLADLFRVKVLDMLKNENLIDDVFIDKLMKWRYTTGFSADNIVHITRDDRGLRGMYHNLR
ncbi:MAG: hypothetical protein QNK25_08710 [Desulfobacterales bacterium]|nr:hypothetical protein [Desulfobacterales bacterium]